MTTTKKPIQPPRDKRQKARRLRACLKTIETYPDHWRQQFWHCGTSHCFAGIAQFKARGLDVRGTYKVRGRQCDVFSRVDGGSLVRREAKRYLGLSEGEAAELFGAGNSVEDIRLVVNEIINAE